MQSQFLTDLEHIDKNSKFDTKNTKNKKKKVQHHELTKEEILLLIEKKEMEMKESVEQTKKEEESEEEGMEKEVVYMVDNVPYEIKDNEVMDPEDYSPIGQSDGKGGIAFEDDEAEERHQLNIKKYNK